MADTDWARIQQRVGSEISYIDPPIDTAAELWFYAPSKRRPRGFELRVYRDGVVTRSADAADLPGGIPTARHTLYRKRPEAFVDVEVHGGCAVIRRGVLDGELVTSVLDPGALEATLASYRALGFRDGTPWNASASQVTVRAFLGAGASWTACVDGTTVRTWSVAASGREAADVAHGSRDAAIEALEDAIARRRLAGFELARVELAAATQLNPVPITAPPGAPRRPRSRSVVTGVARPRTPFEAVDAAVQIAGALHEGRPSRHAVLELVDPRRERARLDELDLASAFSRRLHARRLGRWRKVPRGELGPRRDESSFDYFGRRYGSLTWIVEPGLELDLPGFHVDNVSGGGWSYLQIDASGAYEAMDDLIEATGEPGLEQLLVFHGGWDVPGAGFALDLRAASESGEHPIVAFHEASPRLVAAPSRLKIVPFGDWLYARVKKLCAALERALDDA